MFPACGIKSAQLPQLDLLQKRIEDDVVEGLPNPIYCYPLQKHATRHDFCSGGKWLHCSPNTDNIHMSKSVALLENAKLRHAGFDDSAMPGRAARSGSGVGVARNL